MLRITLVTFLLSFLFVGWGVSAEVPTPVVTRVVTSYVYTGDKAVVTFSDMTQKTYTAEEMGIREYDTFCKNLALGKDEPKIVLPNRYIVVRTTVQNVAPGAPNVLMDTKIEGAVPENNVEDIKAETKVVQP